MNETEKFCKELSILTKFIEFNLFLLQRLLQKSKKEFERLGVSVKEEQTAVLKYYHASNLPIVLLRLGEFQKMVESLYIERFFEAGKRKEAKERVLQIRQNVAFTAKESFSFGFRVGCFCFCALVCLVMMKETELFSNQGSDFAKYMFPMFRGSLILYLYILFYGLNVYTWDRYNIDYRYLFNTQISYSSPYQIMKHSFGFLIVWVAVFTYCALSNMPYFDESKIFLDSVAIRLAPVCWLSFFVYMLFPSTKLFNYESRLFLFKLVAKLFKAMCKTSDFFIH